MKLSMPYVLALFLLLIVGGIGCNSGHPLEDFAAVIIEYENAKEADRCTCYEETTLFGSEQECRDELVLTDDEVERGLGCIEDYFADADPMPESTEEWTNCFIALLDEEGECLDEFRADFSDICSEDAAAAKSQCIEAGDEVYYGQCEPVLDAEGEEYIDTWVDGAFRECFPGW